MKNFIFATFFVLATLQLAPTSEAFIIKTISIQKGYTTIPAPTVQSAEAAAAAYTASKNALVQTVSNAVTEKINTLASFFNGLVQLKARAKQDLWRTTVNASNGVINSVNGIIASKPIYTKSITFGYTPLFTTATIVPAPTTTAATGVVTTTAGHSSSYYKRRY